MTVVGSLVVMYLLKFAVGRFVKYKVESTGESCFGAKITVESVFLSARGFFCLSGLVVQNPRQPGRKWVSEYLLRMEDITVDLSWRRLVFEGVKDVNQLDMVGCRVAFCKPSLIESSNVQLVLDRMRGYAAQAAASSSAPRSAGGSSASGGARMVVRRKSLKSLRATAYFCGEPIEVELADVVSEDVEESDGEGTGNAQWIMSSVLKTLFASAVAGCEDALKLTDMVENAAESVAVGAVESFETVAHDARQYAQYLGIA